MKYNTMQKNLLRSIWNSMGRYLAIAAIIALGAGMFVGLRMTKTDMVATGQKYTDEQNMFDLRLLSTYGWSQSQVDAVAAMEGVVDAEGGFYADAIAHIGEDTQDGVFRFHSIPEQVSRIALQGGRMPQAPDECLADGFFYGDSLLGQKITISESNTEDTLEAMACRTYTVVGYVSSPLYMDMNRGNTSVGNGQITSYFYVPAEGFTADYFTEINITIPGDHAIYSKSYHEAMDAMAEYIEPLLEPLARERAEQVRTDAEEAYRQGMQEYLEGLQEFEEGTLSAEQELSDAFLELRAGEAEIKENEKLLQDGLAQLEEAKELLKTSENAVLQGKQAFAAAKAEAYAQLSEANAQLFDNYKTVNANLREVNSGLLQISTGLIELNSGITQLESGLTQLDSGLQQINLLISIMDASISTAQQTLNLLKQMAAPDNQEIAKLENQLEELANTRDGYVAQRDELAAQQVAYQAQLEELYQTREQLQEQQKQLEAAKVQLEDALVLIDDGFLELQNSQLQAENQFAAAEAQMEAGELQLEAGKSELAEREQEAQEGLDALEQAKQDLAEGWEEFYKGREEAAEALQEAEDQLEEAKVQLEDAREAIDTMDAPGAYVLDRSSNLGYNSLNSSSDIVAGVSKVFPVFFLLVAALVCITTMTRMIDEERTQIGTLKALGYSNGEIIGKYFAYAGSGALVGCGLGVILGSILFPKILWQAYKIMLYLTPDIVITFDWPLCILVVTVYTMVMLLTTWYCCKRTLREVPAELIRPKAPTVGKKIFLERLRLWNKVSFLNKVTIRNIIRYRQRLAMMLVGIGGCTALLLTGFGLRDSIVNIVDYQFEEITVYDMEVYFSEGQAEREQRSFRDTLGSTAEGMHFYYQSSVELDANDQTKELYMLVSDGNIRSFVDMHSGGKALSMPETGEVMLSVGIAEAMDIQTGDTLVLRDPDMQVLELTVSGIYDNNVSNYAIVTPETVRAQWGEAPLEQMAMVRVAKGVDVHQVSADITSMEGVMNVSVSADTAELVGSMMDALDLVVITVVVCAGMLAVIVLYNLTNINIKERIREIATIKVLGFNASETAAYVFKENLTLSVLGTLVGMPLGYLLLEFVMSQIKIDFVWIEARALPLSYILAAALTVLAACFVNYIFYFKLEKINMAEALKSVE